MIEMTFEDHLWCVVNHTDDRITVKEVVEEWHWWVEENTITLNREAWEGYTKAVLTCNRYIED
jgi:hypothetical protein